MPFQASKTSRMCQARCSKDSRILVSTAKSAHAPNFWEVAREPLTAAEVLVLVRYAVHLGNAHLRPSVRGNLGMGNFCFDSQL